MANHKSALKRHRQSLKKRTRNRNVRGSARTAIKNLEKAIKETTDQAAQQTLLVVAERRLQSAAAKGVIKKKTASRKISRLALAMKKAAA
jgi:small subunit ribosomal protein S20